MRSRFTSLLLHESICGPGFDANGHNRKCKWRNLGKEGGAPVIESQILELLIQFLGDVAVLLKEPREIVS